MSDRNESRGRGGRDDQRYGASSSGGSRDDLRPYRSHPSSDYEDGDGPQPRESRLSGNRPGRADEPNRRMGTPSRPLHRDERGDYSADDAAGPERRSRDPRDERAGSRSGPPSGPSARDARSPAGRPRTSRPLYGDDARTHASYDRDDVSSDRRSRDQDATELHYERARGYAPASAPERSLRGQPRDRRQADRPNGEWDEGWSERDEWNDWNDWNDERNDGWAESVESPAWRHDRRGGPGRPASREVWSPAAARYGAAGTSAGWRESTRQWAAAQQKRLFGSRRRVAITLLIVLVVALFGGVPTTVFAFAQYHLVKDGLTHIKNVQADAKVLQKNPFDTNTIAAMRGELVAAHNDFVQVSGKLAPIPGILDVVPIAGSKLGGAQRLVPIAVEGTAAGITACDALTILASSLKNPLDKSANGLTPQAAAQLAGDADQIVATFNQLVPQINALQPSDLSLDPRLGPAIATFKADLPKIEQAVAGLQVFAHLAPQLLGVGQPANYLVEVLDSTELRPGGGFIGNYGILTLNGGRMSDLAIQDVDLLDQHGAYAIGIPSQYTWFDSILVGELRWGLRDSNLDANFATSAQNGETLYAEETQDSGKTPAQLQGVVAITPWLIQGAMKTITGPIDVTDYPTRGHTEVVTPENMIDKIHYYALGVYQGADTVYDSRCGTSLRKCFTGLLFKAFMDKMKQDLAGNMGKFGQLIIDSLHTKDIQIYLNPTSAENVLHQFSLDSSIAAPPTSDSIFEVDANISGNKSSYFLTYNVSDQITLNAAGDATHHLTFSYGWPANPQSLIEDHPCDGCPPDVNHSYSRLYLPPGAVVKGQSGWVDPGSGTAFGRKVLNGATYVHYGDGDKNYGPPHTVTFDYTVPHAATHDASGWHYDLLWQKQSGVTWQMNAQLTLPSCASLAGKPTGFTTTSGKTLSVKEPLLNDVQFAVDYTGC